MTFPTNKRIKTPLEAVMFEAILPNIMASLKIHFPDFHQLMIDDVTKNVELFGKNVIDGEIDLEKLTSIIMADVTPEIPTAFILLIAMGFERSKGTINDMHVAKEVICDVFAEKIFRDLSETFNNV